MSTVFELDEAGWNQRVADARLTPPAETEAGFFDEVGSATGQGIARGGARVGQFLGMLAATPLVLAEKSLGTEGVLTDDYFRALDDTVNSAVDFWTPDAKTTGMAGRVLGGLGEIVLPLAATAGNPVALIGSQQVGLSTDLVRQGVDATTAQAVGGIQGAATAAGFKIPVLGKTLGQRVLTSAVGNTGVNMASTFAQRKAFEAGGYDELAEAYDPLDIEGRTVDLLIGAAFGFLPQGVNAPRVLPSAKNAVLAAANARHFQVDTAPGRPLDAAASAAHQKAMETAMRQLFDGDPVSVDPAVTEANFEARPARAPANPEMVREVIGDIPELQAPRETAPAEPFEYEAGKRLSESESALERKFGEEIGRDLAAAEARYAALEDSKGGKVLNTDTARELSPDYLKDRTKSAAVHEPASELIKRLYAKKLSEPPRATERPLVLFTAGGTGAGKTSAIKSALGPLAEASQIVFDTNMNGFESAVQKIEQALAAAKQVMIAYTYRDPITALREGALPRAMRQEAEHGSGRTVPLVEHLRTHIGSREAIERIASHYAGDPRVRIHVIDNSGTPEQVKTAKLGSIPKFDGEAYNQLREQASLTLAAEREAGRISEAVFRGFAADQGADLGAQSRGIQQPAGAGTRAGPEQERGSVEPRFEPDDSDKPPKPGEPFLVARIADRSGLENANAGNLLSMATFIQRMEDFEQAQPAGSEKSDTMFIYQVVASEPFGPYTQGGRGQMKAEKIGREKTPNRGVVYSFPKGAKFEAQELLALKLSEIKGDVRRLAGTDSFDDLGTLKGAKHLQTIIDDKLQNATPKVLMPKSLFVSTAAGRKLEVAPKVIELADAITSDNSKYPQELQPRQRGARKALDAQVRDIAQNLDPERLGQSAEADRGAPITGAGNIVESGNGRVMALRYVYENLPEKAQEYRKFLESQGYNVSGMKQPVLVRERITELDASQRQAFTVEANQAATAALSPVERAQADARLLDAGALSAMRGGDLTTTQNAGFVRAFLERLTGSERNAMLNPDGSISQEGVRRIQAALLAKAYGGKPESNVTLGRMLESTDSDMRAALGALLDAAPAFARLRQSIADGKVSGEYDISGALTQAIENTAKLRLSGQSLRDFLAQGDMLTARAPIVDNLMKALYDKSGTRIAGREKIAATLSKYAGQAARQRLDQASLFAEPPVSVDDLVNTTTSETEAQAPKVTDMFGLKTPQGSMVTDAAKAALEVNDIDIPTGAVDADGNMEIRSGREIMAEAEANIAKAEADAVGFDAAVSCILTKGLDDAA